MEDDVQWYSTNDGGGQAVHWDCFLPGPCHSLARCYSTTGRRTDKGLWETDRLQIKRRHRYICTVCFLFPIHCKHRNVSSVNIDVTEFLFVFIKRAEIHEWKHSVIFLCNHKRIGIGLVSFQDLNSTRKYYPWIMYNITKCSFAK